MGRGTLPFLCLAACNPPMDDTGAEGQGEGDGQEAEKRRPRPKVKMVRHHP